MSANLCWEPAKRKAEYLPDALKFVLRDKCDLGTRRQLWDRRQIPYLQGLLHAGVDGAQELITAIEKHEAVELWLEY